MENSPHKPTASDRHDFILFVSGMSVKSGHAIENLRKICDEYIPGNFDLRIVDIMREQHEAVNFQIVGVPTLIKTGPGQRRIILGDLSDTQKVLRLLEIKT